MLDARLTLVESTAEVAEFMSWLGQRRPILAFDTETTGLSLAKDRIRLAQFGDGQQGWALPYEDWRGVVREVLGTYDRPLVGHHLKFDAGMAIKDGLPFNWAQAHDTMPMLFLDDSLGPKGLKRGAARHVDSSALAGETALKKAMQKNRWTWATVPIDLPLYWGYGAMDTVLTALLAEQVWPRIQYARAAYDLEMACQRVLCEMELRGVRIDAAYCYEQRERLAAHLAELRVQLGDINPSAPAQVAAALQADGVVLTKRTENNAFSVDDGVLKAVAADSSLASLVLEARTTQKLLSAYFENFLEFREGDILNPHINQLAARTGRMSVTEPALQQIPRSSLVRDAFIPREGNRMVLVDYDNEELRVAAHYSGEPAMLEAFIDGRDLHMETARRLYGPEATRAQRSTAKNAMFAKAYGAGVEKFAATAGIGQAEAAAVFQTLDSLYPALNTIMQRVTAAVRARGGGGTGFVALPDGRRLKVKTDKAYVGFNALIQGTCALVLKQSIVDLDAAGLARYINLPIHDELMLDVPEAEVEEVVPEVKRIMTREDFRAPLTVGAKVVERWGDPYREAA